MSWQVTGKSDAALAGFSSLTFSGPFLLPLVGGGWNYGASAGVFAVVLNNLSGSGSSDSGARASRLLSA